MFSAEVTSKLWGVVELELPVPPSDGFVQLIGIRGLFGEELNEWNDGLLQVIGYPHKIGDPGEKSLLVVFLYLCTTDPGLPLPGRRVHKDGLAWLMPGMSYRFVRGKHKTRSALIQAEPFNVMRVDPGKEVRGDLNIPGRIFTNVAGLNIHDAMPVDYKHVNMWSQGCIAIRHNDGWSDFYRRCRNGLLHGSSQQVFPMRMTAWNGAAIEEKVSNFRI